MNESGPDSADTSRKQRLIVAIAVLLFVAALITAVVWALVVERNRTAGRATTQADAHELRV